MCVCIYTYAYIYKQLTQNIPNSNEFIEAAVQKSNIRTI